LIGIISAFGAAFAWTYACFIWRSQTNINKPLEINFSKNLIAFLVFCPAIFILDYSYEFQYIIFLILSGIIGIGLGDTFYLESLKRIGTRKTLSIEAISPLIAAFAGKVFINEDLSILSWIGILIVSGALFTIISRTSLLIDKDSKLIISKPSFRNLIYSFLSVFCAVIAALLSRLVLINTNLSPFQTTEIRLLGGILFLVLITRFKINIISGNLNNKDTLKFIISVLVGTNLAILLQQIVFQLLPLGIGWTLLSTSPIISLFYAEKEEGSVTKETILFTLILFFGLSLIIS